MQMGPALINAIAAEREASTPDLWKHKCIFFLEFFFVYIARYIENQTIFQGIPHMFFRYYQQ